METKENIFESLLERAEAYTKTTFELFKLKLTGKFSDLVSSLISRVVLFFSLSVFIFTLNIAVALWLGDLLGKNYYGFLIVAGFYGLLTFIFIFLHKPIKTSIANTIIKKLLN